MIDWQDYVPPIPHLPQLNQVHSMIVLFKVYFLQQLVETAFSITSFCLSPSLVDQTTPNPQHWMYCITSTWRRGSGDSGMVFCDTCRNLDITNQSRANLI